MSKGNREQFFTCEKRHEQFGDGNELPNVIVECKKVMMVWKLSLPAGVDVNIVAAGLGVSGPETVS